MKEAHLSFQFLNQANPVWNDPSPRIIIATIGFKEDPRIRLVSESATRVVLMGTGHSCYEASISLIEALEHRKGPLRFQKSTSPSLYGNTDTSSLSPTDPVFEIKELDLDILRGQLHQIRRKKPTLKLPITFTKGDYPQLKDFKKIPKDKRAILLGS